MKCYKRKLTPPHLEKAVQIINGLRILRREGIIHLNNISFDEELIEKLEMMNPDRSRTRQMLLISEAAKELASEHQETDKTVQLKRIPQCRRPTPEKYLHAIEVFERFLEKERLVSGPLKNYLELSDEGVSEEKRILEKNSSNSASPVKT